MSFRLRVALLTAAAVAVAAIAAGAVMYLLVQQQLDTAFNDTLRTSAQTARLQGGPRPDDRFGHGAGTVRVEYLSGRATSLLRSLTAPGTSSARIRRPASRRSSSRARCSRRERRRERMPSLT